MKLPRPPNFSRVDSPKGEPCAETCIAPAAGLSTLSFAEVVRYRDLLWYLVRREFLATYQQTLLGPSWLVVQPLVTVAVMVAVFGHAVRLSTAGLPAPVFYLSGLLLWSFFSQTLVAVSGSLRANAHLYQKVYFPRLVLPLAHVAWRLHSLVIHLCLLLCFSAYYRLWGNGPRLDVMRLLVFLPVSVAAAGSLALGIGLSIAAVTVRYRDLQQLVALVAQLWMYATPVLYPLSAVSARARGWCLVNPLSSLIETLRHEGWATPGISPGTLFVALAGCSAALGAGLLLFASVEGSFVDDV